MVNDPTFQPGLVAVCGLFGLLAGSFANVCIHRIPKDESIVAPRSRCPRCRTPIAAPDNVPLLSFIRLRGKCRSCGAAIPFRYPLVELLNGALYAAIAALHGVTPASLTAMAFATALVVLGFIDLDHRILPDVVTLPGIGLGIAASLIPVGPSTLESLLSAAGGYLGFGVIAATYRHLRGREGLGHGDWKMAAMLGAFLGWRQTLFAVFMGSLLGTVAGLALMTFLGKDSRYALPFGTFLALGGIAALFLGDAAVAWYGRFLE